MKLTRERKVYAALLGVGAVALVADRLMGGPASASAGLPPVAAAASEAVAKAPASATAKVPLGERLGQLAMAGSLSGESGDAFRIDEVWRTLLEPEAKADSSARAVELPPELSAGGVTLPKVTVVMQNAGGGCAVIDGTVVQVGGTTKGGVTLVGVEQRSVRLLINNVEVVVPVADAAGGSR